ncbi:hypothetical protein OROMI_023516 [Orobanche minor]
MAIDYTLRNSRHDQKAFLPLIIFLLTAIVAYPTRKISAGTTTFDMFHRDHPLLGHAPRTQLERMSHIVRNDMARVQSRVLSSPRRQLAQRNAGPGSSNPLIAGAEYGSGEYYAKVVVGTPGQDVWLAVDTGSDLTWMNCKYNNVNNSPNGLVFRDDLSTSFRVMPCSISECQDPKLIEEFPVLICPSNTSDCSYDYSYTNGSVHGVFAYDNVTLGLTNNGEETTIANMLIGCTNTSQNLGTVLNGSHGIMGLSTSPFSLPKQASQLFGTSMFSYCLVDHLSDKNTSSKLIFGSIHQESMPAYQNMSHTKLVVRRPISPFYAVIIQGIYIAGKRLDIKNSTWNNYLEGGAILDSGTSLTALAEPAYVPVTVALNESLSLFMPPTNNGPPGLQYCYEAKNYNETLVPKLEIAFEDGAILKPPSKSYVIVVSDTVRCLGFLNAGWPAHSTIGNIMQQEHLWTFDIDGNKLGFASSKCTY